MRKIMWSIILVLGGLAIIKYAGGLLEEDVQTVAGNMAVGAGTLLFIQWVFWSVSDDA